MLAQNQISIFSESSRNVNVGRIFLKMPNLFESLENLYHLFEISTIAIFVVIFEKSRFWPEFSKNLYSGRNLEKSQLESKFSKNRDFGRNFRKISSWVEIFDKSPFYWKFSKNLNFGGNLSLLKKKSLFCSKFSKITVSQNFFEILTNVKIFEKSWFLPQFLKIFIFFKMFWNHLGFCRNFLSIHVWFKFPLLLILYKMLEKSRFPWKFSNNLDIDQNCSKSQFLSTFIENLHFRQFVGNIDFGQDFRNISIVVEILRIFQIW